MGWNRGNEILDEVWPIVQDIIDNDDQREEIYLVLVRALENQDADTLGKTVYCTAEQVDPALVNVLLARGHLDPEDLEED